MLRFRGKRAWYLIFAAFASFLIFSWSRHSEPQISDLDFAPPNKVQDVFEPPPIKPNKAATTAPVIEKPKEFTSDPVPDPIAEKDPIAPAKTPVKEHEEEAASSMTTLSSVLNIYFSLPVSCFMFRVTLIIANPSNI